MPDDQEQMGRDTRYTSVFNSHVALIALSLCFFKVCVCVCQCLCVCLSITSVHVVSPGDFGTIVGDWLLAYRCVCWAYLYACFSSVWEFVYVCSPKPEWHLATWNRLNAGLRCLCGCEAAGIRSPSPLASHAIVLLLPAEALKTSHGTEYPTCYSLSLQLCTVHVLLKSL